MAIHLRKYLVSYVTSIINFSNVNPLRPWAKARRDFVHKNKLCYLCFSPHLVRNCKKQYVCTVPECDERRSKSIHVDDRCTNALQNGNSNADFGQNTQTVNNGDNGHTNSCRSSVYLPIVPVEVNNNSNTYYTLLDTGLTNSFNTELLRWGVILRVRMNLLRRIESDDADRCGFSLDDRKVLDMWDRETVFMLITQFRFRGSRRSSVCLTIRELLCIGCMVSGGAWRKMS